MTVDIERLRAWLTDHLVQSRTIARLEQYREIGETLGKTYASAMTDSELARIWIDLRNGVSELPNTSANLVNAEKTEVLRYATGIAQDPSGPPGARLIKLYRFFRLNGERSAQLAHYVRAVALFDPGRAPTVTTYRTLPGTTLAALGFSGAPTAWEQLIQDGNAADLDAAITYAADFIARVLPRGDAYDRAVGLELTPAYLKEVGRDANPELLPALNQPPPPPKPEKPRELRRSRPPANGVRSYGRKPGRSSPGGPKRTPRPRRET